VKGAGCRVQGCRLRVNLSGDDRRLACHLAVRVGHLGLGFGAEGLARPTGPEPFQG
jgi:hypothetical protein